MRILVRQERMEMFTETRKPSLNGGEGLPGTVVSSRDNGTEDKKETKQVKARRPRPCKLVRLAVEKALNADVEAHRRKDTIEAFKRAAARHVFGGGICSWSPRYVHGVARRLGRQAAEPVKLTPAALLDALIERAVNT
jgi:hypothetical protein